MASRPITALDRAAATYIDGYLRMRGITPLAASKMAGIPHATFYRYIDGSRTMTVADFITVLDAFGLDVAETIDKVRRIAADLDRA